MNDYTMKIKEICDALGSINLMGDEDEMVQICLSCPAQRYKPIRMAICTREKPPSFFYLQSMLMDEENHVCESRSTQPDNRMLCTEADRPRGHGENGMMAADKSKIRGIIDMPTTVLDPPQAGAIKVALETGKGRLR